MTDPKPATNETTDDVEVLIVGAGPAGLAAALVHGRQQRRVLVVDDGRPRNAPVEHMQMYLTRDGENPAVFRQRAREEIAAHPKVTIETGRVASIEAADEDGFTASIASDGAERQVRARRVLLASGVRDRLDGLPGLAERWGKDVVHCAYCHGYESLGRRIVVVSERPMDTMLGRYLADRFSKDVVVCTNGHTPDPQIAEAAVAAGARIVTEKVTGLSGPAGAPKVELEVGSVLEADLVFHRPEFDQSNDLAVSLGCEINDDHGPVVLVGPTMETSVPGVFAVGDMAMLRGAPAPTAFVTSAAADGQRAAVWIESQLFTS